jgi:hypothetical protein
MKTQILNDQDILNQLSEADKAMLRAGKRTGMVQLENLYLEGFHISSISAKLSVKDMQLLIHPKYLAPKRPEYLTDTEVEALEKGETTNIEKTVKGKTLLVEFDADTNEYLMSDEERIQAPDHVNSEPISPDQKERFRKGKEVKLEDGTILQYTASEPEGIRSNRIALIASIIVDGGVSFMLYHGLKALLGKKHDERASEQSKGYKQALEDSKKATPRLDLNQSHGRKGPSR